MRIISIVCNSYSSLIQNQINSLVEYLCEHGTELKALVDGEEDKIIDLNIDEADERTNRLVRYYVSNILYKVLVEEFILKKLSRHLSERYNFLSCSELSELKKNIADTLKEDVPMSDILIYCMNRKNIVLDGINECINESDSINVKGFLDFRYKKFEGDIEACTYKIVEKFIAEKEYNEFINLLKYFVGVQESKTERADIYVDGSGRYSMVDEKGKNLLENMTSDLDKARSGFDICQEDYVISSLITCCPKKIVIHQSGRRKNDEFIGTIKKVFEDRVKIVEEDDGKCGLGIDMTAKDFIKIPIDSDIKL